MAPFYFKKCRKKERLPFSFLDIFFKGRYSDGNEVMVRILYVSIKIMWILYSYIFFCLRWHNEENNFCSLLNLTEGLSIFIVVKSSYSQTFILQTVQRPVSIDNRNTAGFSDNGLFDVLNLQCTHQQPTVSLRVRAAIMCGRFAAATLASIIETTL